jgi:hypothetical protein
MDQPAMSFTAVYLKGEVGYTGFVEELLRGEDVVREEFRVIVPGISDRG